MNAGARGTAVGSWATMGFGMFSVLDRYSGVWLGRVGPIKPAGWPGAEVGWSIRREYWRQTLAQWRVNRRSLGSSGHEEIAT